MSHTVDLAQFMSGFLVEADEHLGLASRNLITVESDLKQGRPSPRAIRDLYRSLHTIKGLAAMVGVNPIVDVAHAMETVLRTVDRRGGQLPQAGVELLLEGVRAIEQRVATLAHGGVPQPAPASLIEALADLAVAATQAQSAPKRILNVPPEIGDRLTDSDRTQLLGDTAGRRAVRVDFVPSPARAARGFTITRVRERVAALGEIVKVLPLSRPADPEAPGGLIFALLVVTDATDAALIEAVGGEAPAPQLICEAEVSRPAELALPEEASIIDSAATRGVVRVEVARLDDALEKLSVLVVTRFRLARAVAELGARGADVRDLQQIVHENGRQLRDLRGSIMRARMISAAEMLERVPLLVRGLARSTGKRVTVEIDAGAAELDKAVAERVFPAIVHLVRNAIDHGIEAPADRARAGKPEQSTVRVTCFDRSSNQLELTVEDDGAGVDAQALARRAGREPPTSDEALLALLTMPGLSTRDDVTTTSGRGMGMDIVKRAVVDDLGGELSVRTAGGRGTTFVLRIPLSISIVDVFSFRCGHQSFVVPVSVVDEIVEVDPRQVTRGPSAKGRAEIRLLQRRGTAVPLVKLDGVFHLEPEAVPARKAIIVRRNGQPFAFEIDRMLGQQEVVVRPLEDPLVRRPGVVGSTDLGDGVPTLVLDLVSLSGTLSRRKTDVRP